MPQFGFNAAFSATFHIFGGQPRSTATLPKQDHLVKRKSE
jgi:hypothetical protein